MNTYVTQYRLPLIVWAKVLKSCSPLRFSGYPLPLKHLTSANLTPSTYDHHHLSSFHITTLSILEVTNQIDQDITSKINKIFYFIFNDLSASFCFQLRYLKEAKFITNRKGHWLVKRLPCVGVLFGNLLARAILKCNSTDNVVYFWQVTSDIERKAPLISLKWKDIGEERYDMQVLSKLQQQKKIQLTTRENQYRSSYFTY